MEINQLLFSMEHLNIVSAADFIKLLQEQKGSIGLHGATLVKDAIDLRGLYDKLPSLHIRNVVFLGWVTVTDFKDPEQSIDFTDCEFFQHLRVKECIGKCISLHSCNASAVSLQDCKYESAFLRDVHVSGRLNFGGLMLNKKKGCFHITETTYEEFILLPTADSTKKNCWPIIKTDDEALILQLCALGIPVAIDTQLAKKMVAKGLPPATLRSISGS